MHGGNRISLTCNVEARPRVDIAEVKWLRDGLEVQASAISSSGTTSTLDIEVGKIFEKFEKYVIYVNKRKVLILSTNFILNDHFKVIFFVDKLQSDA